MDKEAIFGRLSHLQDKLDCNYLEIDSESHHYPLLTPENYEIIKKKCEVKQENIESELEACLDNLDIGVNCMLFENECLKKEIEGIKNGKAGLRELKGYVSFMEEEIRAYRRKIKQQKKAIRRQEYMIKSINKGFKKR